MRTHNLNISFPMPFNKSARITVTNEGTLKVETFYYKIDMQAYSQLFPPDTYYFHAQYRQCTSCQGWIHRPQSNGNPKADDDKNLDGEGNYIFLEAAGRGRFVGVTQSIFQNQDGWWGEGDDMIFVHGEKLPSINGTGSGDCYLGAMGYGSPFDYLLSGAPVDGGNGAEARWSVYHFQLDFPISFTKSIRVTIEHGYANHRSDNFLSVAYWYQAENPTRGSFPCHRWTRAPPGSIPWADQGTQRSGYARVSIFVYRGTQRVASTRGP